MKQYEYKTERIHRYAGMDGYPKITAFQALHLSGKEGWILCAVKPGNSEDIYYFYRETPELTGDGR